MTKKGSLLNRIWEILLGRGPSIYDVRKKIRVLIPPTLSRHASTLAGPPLWTSTRGRHEINTALLKPKAEISLYLNCTISNLYY